MRPLRALLVPLVLLFVVLNALFLTQRNFLVSRNISPDVLIGANTLLFVLGLASVYMHSRAAVNPNPHVFVRSVMGSTVLKMFVLGGAVLIYLALAGPSKNVPAVLCGMGLYVLYTVLEVRSALALNRKKHESNRTPDGGAERISS